MRIARLSIVITAVIITTATVGAHDFWLSSPEWRVRPGATVTILANVGERFPHPTSLTAADRVESLRLVGPAGDQDLSGFRPQGQSLAAEATLPAQPATYMAVMVIKPRVIAIEPSDFHTYLSHEGLDAILRERERRGESETPGRERYARYAKLLIRAGGGSSAHIVEPLGLPVEIVPAVDPTRLRPGATLDVRLLAHGQPVAGALIGAVYASSTGKPDDWPVKVRTDRQGRARLVLKASGPWLIRSVHMTRSEESGAEWASNWASLAFDLAP
jgi:uncharacterized GH25 family protein